MRQNYRGDKRRKEEARKKKQEDKRNKRLGNEEALSSSAESPAETMSDPTESSLPIRE